MGQGEFDVIALQKIGSKRVSSTDEKRTRQLSQKRKLKSHQKLECVFSLAVLIFDNAGADNLDAAVSGTVTRRHLGV